MAIQPVTPGIHHIGLRCLDMKRTKTFYQDIIGFPIVVDSPGLLIFQAGGIFVAFKQAEPKQGMEAVFSPFEIGLDHIALTCESEAELTRFVDGLNLAKVENTGVKLDETLRRKYVAFKDPDRIAWEFYMVL
jgi:catechol 2,3-dioxygenase-like lactoylglutathione lyase family enzyme